MKEAILVALLAATATASAEIRDDEMFANDLRTAFGDKITACRGDACRTEVRALLCTGRTCTAFDAIHGDAALVVRGPAAIQLGDHLAEASRRSDANRTTAWSVSCSSAAGHGHCHLALAEGDRELDAALAPFADAALGGKQWTGWLQVRCTGDAGPCRVSCRAGTSTDVEDICHGADITVTDRAFARTIVRRAGGAVATVRCRGWRDNDSDGGLLDAIACEVRSAPVVE